MNFKTLTALTLALSLTASSAAMAASVSVGGDAGESAGTSTGVSAGTSGASVNGGAAVTAVATGDATADAGDVMAGISGSGELATQLSGGVTLNEGDVTIVSTTDAAVDAAVQAETDGVNALRSEAENNAAIKAALEAKGCTSANVVGGMMDDAGKLHLFVAGCAS